MAEVRQQHTGRRVLLAEDNPINEEVARELLALVGVTVDTAPDGAAAVRLALNHDYDLVLMDVQMPLLDGLTATRAIRAAGRRVPIVALTANVLDDDRAACFAAGMNDHVGKPVNPEIFDAALARWLPREGEPAGSAAALPAPAAARSSARLPLTDRLGVVAGFDVNVALKNVGGHESALERVLNRFVDKYRDGEPALAGAAPIDPIGTWRRACHSLRGACATLGASILPAGLATFEQALVAGHDVALLTETAQRLNDELLSLTARLAQALQR